MEAGGTKKKKKKLVNQNNSLKWVIDFNLKKDSTPCHQKLIPNKHLDVSQIEEMVGFINFFRNMQHLN